MNHADTMPPGAGTHPPSLTLIRDADCFAPAPLGRRDVLLAGNVIGAVTAPGELALGTLAPRLIEARGRRLIPGLIDPLTHPCGGGGEGGFQNRTPEVSAVEFLRAGVTSPVGALGTDSITRSLEVLYGTVMGLRAAGLSAHMYTGAYRIPAPTLTGDVARDLVLIDPVIGVGEVAISDSRSSQPTTDELRRLASEVALGGTLSGKGGIVFVHVGDGADRLAPLEAVLSGTELNAGGFLPTHINRSAALLAEGARFTQQGGWADLTVSTTPELVAAGDIPALEAFERAVDDGADPSRLTFSSDAGGSLPHYEQGRLLGLTAARPGVLLDLLKHAEAGDAARYGQILAAMTVNPARCLGLGNLGRIRDGYRADLVLLDDTLERPSHVFCHGRSLLGRGDTPHNDNGTEDSP